DRSGSPVLADVSNLLNSSLNGTSRTFTVRPELAALICPTILSNASFSDVPEAPYASQIVSDPLRAAGPVDASPWVAAGWVAPVVGALPDGPHALATRVRVASSPTSRIGLFIVCVVSSVCRAKPQRSGPSSWIRPVGAVDDRSLWVTAAARNTPPMPRTHRPHVAPVTRSEE